MSLKYWSGANFTSRLGKTCDLLIVQALCPNRSNAIMFKQWGPEFYFNYFVVFAKNEEKTEIEHLSVTTTV